MRASISGSLCNFSFVATPEDEGKHQWVVVRNTFVNVVDAPVLTSLRAVRSDPCMFVAEEEVPLRSRDAECVSLPSTADSDACANSSIPDEKSSVCEEEAITDQECHGEPRYEDAPLPQETLALGKSSVPTQSNFDAVATEEANARLKRENEALQQALEMMTQRRMQLQAADFSTQCRFVCAPSQLYFACSSMPPCSEQQRSVPETAQCSRMAYGSEATSSLLQSSDASSSSERDVRTTVMLRNLPNNYTRAMVLELLESKGFDSSKFNFFYLPIDFNTNVALGYAFVDLVHPFWKAFDGFSSWALPSRKACFVSWCEPCQGLQAHIERYRNSPIMHDSVPDEFQPLLLENGRRVPFPRPTKSIRAPRLRHCRRQQ